MGPRRVITTPFAAPTRAQPPARKAAESLAAACPGGREANLSGKAPDLAALVATFLFVGAVIALLAGLTGAGGAG